jgi:hypothetical protein
VALAPHRLPRSSQTRVASQTGLRALLDEAELLGSAAPSPATAGGSITLGGTDNGQARAPAVAAGVVLFGGSATAQARTTAAGSISLGGAVGASAPAAASGSISLSGAATGTPVGSSNVQYVGGSTTNSGASAVTSMAITGPSAPSTFAIFYASRASGTATGAMTGVTDTAGNTWVRATRGGVSGASNTRIEIWYCENYTPATTITGAGPSFVSAWGVAGFSGLVNASSLDVTTADYSVGSTATTITAPSITTSQSDLIFAADSHTTDATGALQSPFTQLSTYSLSGGGGGQAGYLIAPTAGTYTATWTQSTASSVGVAVVGFKATVAVGTAATAAGSISLGGTPTARAVDTALGGIALGGTVAPAAPDTASGGVTLGGAPAARGAASAVAGSITLGGTSTGTALAIPGSVLNIGSGAGKNHFDVQIAPNGSSSIEVHTQAEIEAGYTDPLHFYTSPDGQWVVFRPRADGPTTSGSSFARDEMREVTAAGSNMKFNVLDGEHELTVNFKIMHVPANDPDVVVAQLHDGNNDVIALRTQMFSNGTVVLGVRFNGSLHATRFQSSFTAGTAHTIRTRVFNNGAVEIYYNGGSTPFISMPTGTIGPTADPAGWYWKWGAYNQFNDTATGATGLTVPASEYSEVWHQAPTVVHAPTGALPATASGGIILDGAPAAQAPVAGGGSITLAGAPTARAVATATGQITLGGITAGQVAVAAAGQITLNGTVTARAAVTAAGGVTLAGTVTPVSTAAAAGGVTLAGAVAAAGALASGGVVTLSGSVSPAAPAVVGGSIALGGSEVARAASVTAGGISLAGFATFGTPPATAAGLVTLGGSAVAGIRVTLTGLIVIGGTVAARAPITAGGLVVIGGAVTARVPSTVAGLITLNALAAGHAQTFLQPLSAPVFGTFHTNGVGTTNFRSNGIGYAQFYSAGLVVGASFTNDGVGYSTLRSDGASSATFTDDGTSHAVAFRRDGRSVAIFDTDGRGEAQYA